MKGIIVVDMPECCGNCDFAALDDDLNISEEAETYCKAEGYSINNMGIKSKPSWCPIRPMPERKEGGQLALSPLLKEGLTDYERGWNDCIDSIEGRNENEADA